MVTGAARADATAGAAKFMSGMDVGEDRASGAGATGATGVGATVGMIWVSGRKALGSVNRSAFKRAATDDVASSPKASSGVRAGGGVAGTSRLDGKTSTGTFVRAGRDSVYSDTADGMETSCSRTASSSAKQGELLERAMLCAAGSAALFGMGPSRITRT